MTYLEQAAALLANTQAFSYSGWFKIASGQIASVEFPFDLFAIGVNNFELSRVDYRLRIGSASYFDTSTHAALSVSCGPHPTFTAGPGGQTPGIVHRINYDTGIQEAGISIPNIAGAGGGICHVVPVDRIDDDNWHHLCVGIDAAGTDGIQFTDNGNGTATINSVSRVRKIDIVLDGVVHKRWYGLNVEDLDPTLGVNLSSRQFEIGINGLAVGEPSPQMQMENGFNSNTAIRLAHVQVWLSQYIDWTNATNFSKIVRNLNGTLYPSGGTVAADAFGMPDIWFERDSVSGVLFETNLGTAGDFNLVGTLPSDFIPPPTIEE